MEYEVSGEGRGESKKESKKRGEPGAPKALLSGATMHPSVTGCPQKRRRTGKTVRKSGGKREKTEERDDKGKKKCWEDTPIYTEIRLDKIITLFSVPRLSSQKEG